MAVLPHQHYTWAEYLTRLNTRSPWRDPIANRPAETWSGGQSFKKSVALAVTGWDKGRDMLDASLRANARPIDLAPIRSLDVGGAYPVVPIAVAGDPCCMVRPGVEIIPRAVYRLVISNSVRSEVSAVQFKHRGVAICRIVDALEAAGSRVEIIADSTADASSETLSFSYTVKEADQPLDIDRVAFVFAHAAAHRYCNFHLREFIGGEKRWGGYGASKNPNPKNHPDAIVIPYLSSSIADHYNTVEGAVAHISGIMREAGLDITQD